MNNKSIWTRSDLEINDSNKTLLLKAVVVKGSIASLDLSDVSLGKEKKCNEIFFCVGPSPFRNSYFRNSTNNTFWEYMFWV